MTRTAEMIAADYRSALNSGDHVAARRNLQEETALVLIQTLGRLTEDRGSFVHKVALKGGALMLGELGSPRFSADLDFTYGHRAGGMTESGVADDIERAGRPFAMKVTNVVRNKFSLQLALRYQSQCTGTHQPSKAEISLREDPVGALREAGIDGARWGISRFTVHALDVHDLVAEKLRTLYQRAQPRDLYDLWFYLTQTGLHLDARLLRAAADAKFKITRIERYGDEAWKAHLDEISSTWTATLGVALDPTDIPSIEQVVRDVETRLASCGIR